MTVVLAEKESMFPNLDFVLWKVAVFVVYANEMTWIRWKILLRKSIGDFLCQLSSLVMKSPTWSSNPGRDGVRSLLPFAAGHMGSLALMGRGFANEPEDLGSIPGRFIPKTLKMVLDTPLLNTQQYKVRVKNKVGQSWE